MVEFDTSQEKKKTIDLIESLYAICGEDEEGKTRLLVFGYEFASAKIPVTELTSPFSTVGVMANGIASRKFAKTLESIHKPRAILTTIILLLLRFGQTKRKIKKSSFFSKNLD